MFKSYIYNLNTKQISNYRCDISTIYYKLKIENDIN